MHRDKDGFGPDEVFALTNVSRETMSRIEIVVALLDEWRRRVNLIGPAEMPHIWRRHVLDSLQLAPHVDLKNPIVDLGSGAGFPGLILAACMAKEPGHVTLVETIGKKCAFLDAAVNAAHLSASVRQGRVENVRNIAAKTVTARAFAPLPALLDYAAKWLENGAVGVFPKGRRWQEELTQAQEYWRFAHEVIPSRSGDGVILKVSEVSRVNS